MIAHPWGEIAKMLDRGSWFRTLLHHGVTRSTMHNMMGIPSVYRGGVFTKMLLVHQMRIHQMVLLSPNSYLKSSRVYSRCEAFLAKR